MSESTEEATQSSDSTSPAQDSKPGRDPESVAIRVFIGAVLFVAFLCWLWAVVWGPNSGGNLEDRALLGDSFGWVNALFSGIALAGVVAALYMQRVELKLQRKQLAAQLEEMSLARQEMRLQLQEMKTHSESLRRSERAQAMERFPELRALSRSRAEGWIEVGFTNHGKSPGLDVRCHAEEVPARVMTCIKQGSKVQLQDRGEFQVMALLTPGAEFSCWVPASSQTLTVEFESNTRVRGRSRFKVHEDGNVSFLDIAPIDEA